MAVDTRCATGSPSRPRSATSRSRHRLPRPDHPCSRGTVSVGLPARGAADPDPASGRVRDGPAARPVTGRPSAAARNHPCPAPDGLCVRLCVGPWPESTPSTSAFRSRRSPTAGDALTPRPANSARPPPRVGQRSRRPWRAATPRSRRPWQPTRRPWRPAGPVTARSHGEAAQTTPQRVRRTQATIIPTLTEGSSTRPDRRVARINLKPAGHTPPVNGHSRMSRRSCSCSSFRTALSVTATNSTRRADRGETRLDRQPKVRPDTVYTNDVRSDPARQIRCHCAPAPRTPSRSRHRTTTPPLTRPLTVGRQPDPTDDTPHPHRLGPCQPRPHPRGKQNMTDR